jgi:hypothetical protein
LGRLKKVEKVEMVEKVGCSLSKGWKRLQKVRKRLEKLDSRVMATSAACTCNRR